MGFGPTSLTDAPLVGNGDGVTVFECGRQAVGVDAAMADQDAAELGALVSLDVCCRVLRS